MLPKLFLFLEDRHEVYDSLLPLQREWSHVASLKFKEIADEEVSVGIFRAPS